MTKTRRYFTVSLALFAMGSTAHAALTHEQKIAIVYTIYAEIAGTSDRCPTMQLIKEAQHDELESLGVSVADRDEVNYTSQFSFVAVFAEYKENPSKFCRSAWSMFGPGGTYRRQMLKEK
jgi:hypothetical protein